VPIWICGKLMLGKRSMGIRFRDVAPSSTMARDAISTAMAFRMAARVSHIRY